MHYDCHGPVNKQNGAASLTILHALDTSLSGHKQMKIRRNDTDAVLLAILVVKTFLADELYIANGTGKLLHNLRARTGSMSLG